MFQGFLFVLLFILAFNTFFSQSFDATETNSINGIFAFSRRSFNSAHLTWPSPKSNKTLTILAFFLSGDIQTNPGPSHQPVYPCGFCELAVSWSPNEEAVCCDNAQTYSGYAVGAKHLIYQASHSEALKSLQVFTNQLLMKTSLLNHSLQHSTHSSLAVPNQ